MIKNNQLVMNKIWINTYSQVKNQIRKLTEYKTRNKMFLVSEESDIKIWSSIGTIALASLRDLK